MQKNENPKELQKGRRLSKQTNFTPKSQISRSLEMFFRYYLTNMFLKYLFRYCLEVFLNMFETNLNYSSRFPEGVEKEEIQQWRQARSRPAEKKTLNIMLKEKKL